jgi:uncharacterized damage-inducible protein DinB
MENHPETILVEFIRYNNWANHQVLQACQNLSEEQLDTAAPGAYGTIRDTLLHLLWAEADYVGRLTGARPYPTLFKRGDLPSVAGLSAFASDVAPALLDAIQRIPPNHIVHEEEDGNTFEYQARGLFIQVVNHGIEHRTNITTLLSSLGIPAPEVDGWGYMEAHPDQFEVKSGSQ